MSSIYQKAIALEIPTDQHESDLYMPVNNLSRRLVKEYEHRQNVTTFKSQIDGQLWYEVPFAYDPWWDRANSQIDQWTSSAILNTLINTNKTA
jgi:hypothetical protein